MKKIKVLLIALIAVGLSSVAAYSQAFEGKGHKSLNLGLGGSYHWFFNGSGYYGYYNSLGLGFNAPSVSMEFGIHDYVGLGFWVAPTHHFGYYSSGYAFSLPIAFRADFHFYQLIADKTGSNIHADQLDIYAGLSVGGGPGFWFNSSSTDVFGVFLIGPQAGIRWYPNAGRIGIYAEVSPYIGKSFAEVGAIFKL